MFTNCNDESLTLLLQFNNDNKLPDKKLINHEFYFIINIIFS